LYHYYRYGEVFLHDLVLVHGHVLPVLLHQLLLLLVVAVVALLLERR
jgi:predicted membrane chloride channel (bestrophin family)